MPAVVPIFLAIQAGFAAAYASAGILGAVAFGAGLVAGIAQSTLGMVIFGGISLMKSMSGKRSDGISSSPTYSATASQTQTNNRLPIPMVYGSMKVAGNRIYQGDNTTGNIRRITAFGYGEIEDFTDIRLNDIKYTDIAGCNVTKYYGTSTQTIPTLVTEGSTNAERAAKVGSLKMLAHLAVEVPASEKISGDYNLTTIIKGRKVKIYTNENTYTTAYSTNPVWCLLDLLTNYNGARLGLDNDGVFSNTELKKTVDLNSFISSAAYCDEIINYYQYTTSFATANSNLIWIGRHANRPLKIQYVSGATPNVSINASDEITVTYTASTTADGVIALVESVPEVNEVVKSYRADNNNGTGIVSALSLISFPINTTEKRFEFNFIFDSDWLLRDCIEEIKKNCRGALVTKGNLLQFKIEKPETVSKVIYKSDIIQGSEIVKTLTRQDRYDRINVKYKDPNYEWSEVTAVAELETYFNDPAIDHEVDILSITNFRQAARMAWHYLNRNIRCYLNGSYSTSYKASDLEIGDVIQLNDFVMNFESLPVRVTKVDDDNSGVFTISWALYDESIYTDELGSLDPVVISTNINNPYAFPSDVQSFSANQNQNLVEFAWTSISDTSATYEIRQGATWDSGTVVATGLTNTSYTSNLTQRGTFTYWIKAKTLYQYSVNATSDILNVQFIPSLNLVVSQDIFEGTGTHNNTYFYNNKLKLNPTQLWEDYSPEKWGEIDDKNLYDSNGNWGGLVETSGSYTSDIFDIGAVLQNIVNFNYDFYDSSIDQDVIFEWRYSNDNITFSDWILSNTGSFSFRYYQVKITFVNPSGQMIWVNNASIVVDVPDKTEIYTNREITNANNGITITYSTDEQSKQKEKFISPVPHIIATPLSNNTYAVVTNSTDTSCTVKLYTNTGNLITGFVNITASGY